MLKTLLSTLALSIAASSAFAQAPVSKRFPKPAIAEAQSDTLNMTCAAATALVLGNPQGVVLRTGATRWDKYVHDTEACGPMKHDLVPQFVRTKDVRACHIGYTCEDKAE
jgi:hypothetical protein